MTRVANYDDKEKRRLQQEARRDARLDPEVRDVERDVPGIRKIRTEVQQEYDRIKEKLTDSAGEAARLVVEHANLERAKALMEKRLTEATADVKRYAALLEAIPAPPDAEAIRHDLVEARREVETYRNQIDKWTLEMADLEQRIKAKIKSALDAAEVCRSTGVTMLVDYWNAFIRAHWNRDRILRRVQPDPRHPIHFDIDPPDWATMNWKVLFEA